jgi:23S rRNA pseudouridine1911/1915/1917 synthase
MMAHATHEWDKQTYLLELEVKIQSGSVRLDSFLKQYYKRRSRQQIQAAIADGRVHVIRNQGPHLHLGKLKPSFALIPGDRVQVLTEKKPEPKVNFNYTVLYEDRHILVVDKPPNLPVHPAGRYFFNTLLVHLRTQGHPNPLELGREYYLAHRIDKETSGVLVLAKDREICAQLVEQFAKRKTKKRYFALVRGITPSEFQVTSPLGRDPRSNITLRMTEIPLESGGLEAETRFERISTHGDFSLLECIPKTGRQHQIRVHLEIAGHPIVGDKLYGLPPQDAVQFYDRKNLSPEVIRRLLMPRHCLHASSIEFFHPKENRRMIFESPLPEDIKDFIKRAEKAGSPFELEQSTLMNEYVNEVLHEWALNDAHDEPQFDEL